MFRPGEFNGSSNRGEPVKEARRISAKDVWPIIVGEEHGDLVRSILMQLLLIDEKVFDETIRKIDIETAMGPLLDPSAYTDGRRFDNAREYAKILRALLELKRCLPKVPSEGL